MIEFNIKNRRLRLYPDGVITCRAIRNGKETKMEIWKVLGTTTTSTGYLKCKIAIDGVEKTFLRHRIVALAHNPGWDIFDTSMNNMIDHKNNARDDNSGDNLRVVSHQQNQFNRSGVKGYSWIKSKNKWRSSIKSDHIQYHLGYYDTEEEARAAYLKAKEELHIIN